MSVTRWAKHHFWDHGEHETLEKQDLQAEITALRAENATLKEGLAYKDQQIEHLTEQEMTLKSILQDMPSAVVLFDADLVIKFAEASAHNLWELPDRLFHPGSCLKDILLACAKRGDFGPGFEEELAEAAHCQILEAPNLSYERRLPSGRVLNIQRTETKDGGLMSIFTDITPLAKARKIQQDTERHLRHTTEMLRATVDSLPAGVLSYDQNFNCTVVNSQFNQVMRFPPGLVQEGHSLDDGLRFQAARGDFGPGAVEDWMAWARDYAFEPMPQGYEMRLPDGHVLYVRRSRLPDGGMVAVYVDVTIQAEAEAQLRQNEENLRKILESAPAAVTIAEIGGQRLWVNQRSVEFFGAADKDDLLTRPIAETYAEDAERPDYQRIMAEGGGEVLRRRLDGSLWWSQMHAMHFTYGGREAMLIWMFDISDRKKTEQEMRRHRDWLEKLNQQKNKLFSIIAHDLRGPFNALIGLSELLALRAQDMDSQHISQDAALMYQNCKQFMSLLDNLLDWARAQMDHQICTPERVFLDQTIADLLTVYQPIAHEKGVALENKVGPVQVVVDPGMLLTVLRNLIANAVKFTRQGDFIRLTTCIEGDSLRLSVEDNGIGIAPERAEKIFDLNGLSSTVGTAGETGTGLGLPLCKDLMERNGGEIRLTSAFGGGSRFDILLPLDSKHHDFP